MPWRVAPPVLLLSIAAACDLKGSPPPPPSPAASAASPSPSAAVAGTLHIGAPITAAMVPLSELAKNPAAYQSKTVATSGTVFAVCQEMGCWMEIRDASGEAHVKMAGHHFFVPKTASGRSARVQAVVQTVDPHDESAEEAADQTGKPVAKLQLEATGVELD